MPPSKKNRLSPGVQKAAALMQKELETFAPEIGAVLEGTAQFCKEGCGRIAVPDGLGGCRDHEPKE